MAGNHYVRVAAWLLLISTIIFSIMLGGVAQGGAWLVPVMFAGLTISAFVAGYWSR